MFLKSKFRIDTRLALILLFYLVLGFLLLGYYQYQVNPDGVGYIQTALKYLSGDFYEAVNAYWGPLLSWLLLPFLYFNQTPTYTLYSAKILSLVVGFFTIIGIWWLSLRFRMEETVRIISLLISVPIILYFSLSVITPDLLIVCFMVYYLALIFNPDYPNKVSYALLCGFLGAVAFMGKSFILPFFIVQFLIINLLHYYYQRDLKIKISRNLILGFITFLLVSGFWIGLISAKEERLTFGTSGEYNHALVGPDSVGFPQFSQGLSGPGEINQEKAVKNWSPFESWSNFMFQMKLIWDNIIQTLSIYQYFSFLSILIIIGSLILFIPSFKRFTGVDDRRTVLFSLVTILIYSGGYLPVLVEERYLWLVYILLILLGGLLISLLFKKILISKFSYKNLLKWLVLIIFTVSFIYMPITSLYTNLNTGKDIYTLSNILKTEYGVEGNIATDNHLIDTQYLSFYLNTTSYGQSKKDISSADLQSQLDKYEINYYLVWGNSTQYLIGYTEITGGKIKNLRIYKRN